MILLVRSLIKRNLGEIIVGWFNKLINTGVLKVINNQQKTTQETTEEHCSFTKNGEAFNREDYIEATKDEAWLLYSQDYIFYQGKPRIITNVENILPGYQI